MKQIKKKLSGNISVILSLLMLISVISFPALKAKAVGYAGTLDDFVERCYTVTLDRGSDPDGFAYWKGRILNGEAVGIEVAYGFLFSPEYTKKNKSNEDFVKDLYTLFMGREPEEDGYRYWIGKLNEGKSRLEIFAGFANSPEFYNICNSYEITAGRYVVGYERQSINEVNLFVERLYKICLGRKGDLGGQETWVEQLMKKQISGSECAHSFIFSPEYTEKGLSNEEYVENLYLAMMGRNSDAAGKADWLNALAEGKTRDEVFAGFANSPEFAAICAEYKIDKGNYVPKDVYKPLRFRLKKSYESGRGYYLIYEYQGDTDEVYRILRYSNDGTLLGTESQTDKTENGEIKIFTNFDSQTGAIMSVQRQEIVWNSDKTKCVTTNINNLTGEVTSYLEEFYENGRIVKLRAYDKNHNLTRYCDYEYPEENRIISDDYTYSWDYRQKIDEKTYYDENGLISKVETTISTSKGDGSQGECWTVVDDYEDGNLIGTKRIDHTRGDQTRIQKKNEYKDGKLYKEYSYNAIQDVSGWQLYEYNSKGLLLKKAWYSADDSSNEGYGYICEYDEYDNKIKEINFTHVVDSRYREEPEITFQRVWEYERY